MKKLTEKEIQWLIENYPKKRQCDCAAYLLVSNNVIRRFARQLGLQKEPKPYAEVSKPKEKKPKPGIIEAGKGYCIECAFYVVGGMCGRTARITGALHKKECFKPNEQ